jgi:hypothetical protein
MSADSIVVFYGAQLPLSDTEINACETRQHPMIKAARESRLDHYWADFIPNDEHGPELLVGRCFGKFGLEDSLEAHFERGTIDHSLPARFVNAKCNRQMSRNFSTSFNPFAARF